jgi:hypothetical protein
MSLDAFAALSLDDGSPSDTVTVITLGDIEDVAPSDLRLQCGTTVFEVHCAILEAASPVWRAMVSGPASDDALILMLDDASAMHTALRILYGDSACLKIIYSGRAHPTIDVRAVQALAGKYDLVGVTAIIKRRRSPSTWLCNRINDGDIEDWITAQGTAPILKLLESAKVFLTESANAHSLYSRHVAPGLFRPCFRHKD